MIFSQGCLLYIIVQLFCIVRSFYYRDGVCDYFRFLLADVNESSTFIGFMDGASRHTQHSASAAWVIYTPTGHILSSGGICLWPSSNSVVEYSVIIELL